MLKSVAIKNFKKIGSSGIELKKLGRVNYFVGENGCGKSSILESIFSWWNDNFKFAMFPKAEIKILMYGKTKKSSKIFMLCHKNNILTRQFTSDSISGSKHINPGDFGNATSNLVQYSTLDIMSQGSYKNPKGLLWSNQHNLLENQQKDIITSLKLFGIEKYSGCNHFNARSELGETERFFGLEIKDSNNIDNISTLAGGYIYLLNLSFLISTKAEYCDTLFLIEEPEAQLHPKFQKLIPKLINYYTKKYSKLQFLVSTHSPFIISATKGFEDQKVFRIEDGKCLNPEGANGIRVIFESAQMLGMGIDDYVVAPNAKIKNKSYIIFCESEDTKGTSDAELYNQIFRCHKNALFISCGTSQDVYHQYVAAKEFYKNQSGQIGVIGLIDNDGSRNPKLEEWKNIGMTVLGRRDIENYLYDLEIVSKIRIKDQKILQELKKLDIVNDKVKSIPILKQGLKQKRKELAQMITNDTKIYKELELAIFGIQ